jgi:hypothetical protein
MSFFGFIISLFVFQKLEKGKIKFCFELKRVFGCLFWGDRIHNIFCSDGMRNILSQSVLGKKSKYESLTNFSFEFKMIHEREFYD